MAVVLIFRLTLPGVAFLVETVNHIMQANLRCLSEETRNIENVPNL